MRCLQIVLSVHKLQDGTLPRTADFLHSHFTSGCHIRYAHQMAETLAGLGAAAGAAGLVGFLAGTIEKLVVTVEVGRKAQKRLRGYHMQLKTCEAELGEWREKWPSCHDPEAYWGSDGAKEIDQMLADVQSSEEHINKLLCNGWMKHNWNSEGREWSRCIQQYRRDWDAFAQRSPSSKNTLRERPKFPHFRPMPEIMASVAMALWKDKILSDCVEKLRTLIDDLKTVAKRHSNPDTGLEGLTTQGLESASEVQTREYSRRGRVREVCSLVRCTTRTWPI